MFDWTTPVSSGRYQPARAQRPHFGLNLPRTFDSAETFGALGKTWPSPEVSRHHHAGTIVIRSEGTREHRAAPTDASATRTGGSERGGDSIRPLTTNGRPVMVVGADGSPMARRADRSVLLAHPPKLYGLSVFEEQARLILSEQLASSMRKYPSVGVDQISSPQGPKMALLEYSRVHSSTSWETAVVAVSALVIGVDCPSPGYSWKLPNCNPADRFKALSHGR